MKAAGLIRGRMARGFGLASGGGFGAGADLCLALKNQYQGRVVAAKEWHDRCPQPAPDCKLQRQGGADSATRLPRLCTCIQTPTTSDLESARQPRAVPQQTPNVNPRRLRSAPLERVTACVDPSLRVDHAACFALGAIGRHACAPICGRIRLDHVGEMSGQVRFFGGPTLETQMFASPGLLATSLGP